MKVLVVENNTRMLERVEKVFHGAGLAEGLITMGSLNQALEIMEHVQVSTLFLFLGPEQLSDKSLHRRVLNWCGSKNVACVSNLTPDEDLRGEVADKGHLFLNGSMTIDEMLGEIRNWLGLENQGDIAVIEDIYSLELSVFDICLLDGLVSNYSDEMLMSVACMGKSKVIQRINELIVLFDVENRHELIRKYKLMAGL